MSGLQGKEIEIRRILIHLNDKAKKAHRMVQMVQDQKAAKAKKKHGVLKIETANEAVVRNGTNGLGTRILNQTMLILTTNEPRREQSQPSFPVNLGIQYLLEEKILLSIIISEVKPKRTFITKLSKILGLGGLPNRQGGKLQKLLQFLQTYVQSWTLSMQQLAILLRLCCAMFTLATHHETAERQHLVHHLQLVALQLY